ncbi:type VI toxin-antitoxin system SocB family DNA replication inhibitor toxin [Parerythrobacter lacustris]|uniref:Uncharacterized protein n=1 Tax=Parerythrobacter lacustris TaxID=2969984 RepID=A0ABT1XLP0_9SPHN|nr:hypothetical protein [Parerythrobacter lacustris]MCR2832580.1 hypothetical protein [Parerythrobacter lacustris]
MSSRLPETDLANWGFMETSQKRSALETFVKPKQIVGSYEPFRRVFPDAINQQFPLFGEALSGSAWDEVQKRLVRECKGDAQRIAMNKAILSSTHAYAVSNGIAAMGLDVTPLRFFGGTSYGFGLNLLIRYHSHASIVFLDMRKTNGLSISGRRFVFSAMHHRFREAYPDLVSADLEIWRYRNNKSRDLVCMRPTGDLLGWDEMVHDVVETHQIWESVRRGGSDERRASGTFGPLFD